MSIFDGLRHRLHVLLNGEKYGGEVERELRFHLELEVLARSDSSSAAEAETNARRLLGNATYYREEVRRMTILQWFDRVGQDAAYAWRGLKRSPGFALTVVLTLGLGLGVNAAMYSFLDRLFLRNPEGVAAPDGVKRLYIDLHRETKMGGGAFASYFNYPLYKALRERIDPTIPLGAFTAADSAVVTSTIGQAETRISYVNPEYFELLGVHPERGRFFAREEGLIETRTPVVVIGDALWRYSFSADPQILGRVVQIGNRPYTVVGVAPPGFAGVDADLDALWLPLNCFPDETYDKRPWYVGTSNYLRLIARIGSTADVARMMSAGTAAIHAGTIGRRDTTSTLVTGPIIEARGPSAEAQEISISRRLAGVSAIVLLIACANVANLLLLRAAGRRRELAIRRALGVSRARLSLQMLIESLMLALLSGGAALLFALWGGGALRRLLLPRIHWAAAPLDWRIVLITLLVTVFVGLLAGLLPAIGATNPELTSALKAGARNGSYRTPRTQNALLVAQTSLSVVLLVGAGLLVRSLVNVQSIDIGYDTDGVVFATTNVQDADRLRLIGIGISETAQRLRATPGVISVAVANVAPMAGTGMIALYLPGHDSIAKVGGDYLTSATASPEYFQTVGIRLITGRSFDTNDRNGSEPVIVVNEQMAHGLWPNESPIGKCVALRKPGEGCSRVIGVATNTHRSQIIERPAAQFYLPLLQQAEQTPRSLIIRTDGAHAAAVSSALRAEFARLMPDASDYRIRTMAQILEPQLRPWRTGAILFSALGLLALVVASVGIYGVMAYAITQRTHEMGVRLALGAQASDVLNLVLGNGLRVVTIGVMVGALTALALGKLVTSLLFGVVPSDPSVLILATVTLTSLAAIACLIPGWRAARVDPMTALRSE